MSGTRIRACRRNGGGFYARPPFLLSRTWSSHCTFAFSFASLRSKCLFVCVVPSKLVHNSLSLNERFAWNRLYWLCLVLDLAQKSCHFFTSRSWSSLQIPGSQRSQVGCSFNHQGIRSLTNNYQSEARKFQNSHWYMHGAASIIVWRLSIARLHNF